jgi:hypothetical protein
MISIAHYGSLTADDEKVVESLTSSLGEVRNDKDRVPEINFVTMGGGGIGLIHIALLIFTFLGAGAALTFKSFLQSLGSELGKELSKKLLKRFNPESKKEHLPNPVHAAAILYEVKPSVIAIVPFIGPADPGFSSRLQIPVVVESAAMHVGSESAVFWVSFDEKSGLWIAKSQKGVAGLIYIDENGQKRMLECKYQK